MSRADDRAAFFLNVVTWLRVVLTPVVIALLLARTETADAIATVLFGFAAVTDFIDGRLARRWKQTSAFGAFLDTTADKLLVSGALIALVQVGRASAWVAFLIIGREMLVLGLKGAASVAEGSVVMPSLLGKAKANLQFVAIVLAIWRPDILIAGRFLDTWALWVAVAVTVWSGADYVARYFGVIAGRRG